MWRLDFCSESSQLDGESESSGPMRAANQLNLSSDRKKQHFTAGSSQAIRISELTIRVETGLVAGIPAAAGTWLRGPVPDEKHPDLKRIPTSSGDAHYKCLHV